MSETPIISRKVLFSDPDRAEVRLSHDGRYISFLAPYQGVLNLWVAERDNLEAAYPVTEDKGHGIRIYAWAWDHQHILYLQDKEGNEDWAVFALNIETREVRPLTPQTGVCAILDNLSEHFPHECLVYLNERRPDFHDLYKVNILTGDRTLLIQNDEYAGFVTDDHYQIRFASKVMPDGGMCIYQRQADDWLEFMSIGPDDVNTTSVCGFDKSGHNIYVLDSRDADTAGLFVYDLEKDTQQLIFRDSQADVSGFILHPVEKTVQAVIATYDRKRWTFLDPVFQADMAYLHSLTDADIDIVSRTYDDRYWVVVFISDDAPLRYYLFDRQTRTVDYLFCNRKALENLSLAKMHAVKIPTRDHLEMVCYLTIPLQADPPQQGKPEQPLPLILYVHGGPQARDHWGLNPLHQWFANRGYAVLSVNYRGSTGFGKAFIKAGYGEWGAKMHDDLLDAVEWAVTQGIADPAKICIYGGSYGGYAALVGLAFTPEVFACGVDIVGPSNLQTLVASIPAYWKPFLDRWKILIGADPETEEGQAFLKSRSPLTYAEQIVKPLLIGHGANDPRVKLDESEQIVSQLKAKGIPVTYVVYPDEGHGFQRPENRQSFHAVTELFLAQVLGGRAEPIGEDFNGASLEIREGAQLIQGVSESFTNKAQAT
jgi:dipeptidyl aminopeptidase/acylaminoacyl peptidase